MSPTLVKRAQLMSLLGLAAPEFGTAPGIYFLQKKIDHYEYQAASRFAMLRRDMVGTISGPKPPNGVDLAGSSRNAPIDPESAQGQRIAARDRNILDDYNDALLALSGAGRGIPDIVIEFCDGPGQSPTGHEAYLRLRTGLNSLVVHWRLRGKK